MIGLLGETKLVRIAAFIGPLSERGWMVGWYDAWLSNAASALLNAQGTAEWFNLPMLPQSWLLSRNGRDRRVLSLLQYSSAIVLFLLGLNSVKDIGNGNKF